MSGRLAWAQQLCLLPRGAKANQKVSIRSYREMTRHECVDMYVCMCMCAHYDLKVKKFPQKSQKKINIFDPNQGLSLGLYI